MKNTIRLVQLVATTACLLNVNGEETLARNEADLPFYELDEYVVVAHTYAVPYFEVGSTVDTITREELQTGQTTFVLDAIRELPSVSVRNNGGPGNSFGLTVRGLNSDRPIVLIDGIEVSSPTTGRIFNPGLLFSNSVERIEFLKGAQSSLYGADALAGVINVTTRRPEAGESTSTIRAGVGSNNTQFGELGFLLNQGDLDISLGFNKYSSDGFSARDSDSEDDGYENVTLNTKIDYRVTDNLEFFLAGYHVNADADFDNTTNDPSGLSETEQTFATAGAKVSPTEDLESQLSFAYTKVENLSTTNTFVSPFEGQRYKVQWRNIVEIKDNWNLVGGVEFEEEQDDLSKIERDNTSYYLDNKWEVTDGLFWTIGARYDDNSDYGNRDTYRTTLSYLLHSLPARLHGSYGTSFRAPSFFQLAFSPELNEQEGEGWDLGIEFILFNGDVVFDITAYGYDIEDKFTFDPGIPPFGGFVNESYESIGVETSISWMVTSNLSLNANYTYTDAESDVNERPLYTPENQGSVSLTWTTMEDKLSLKSSVLYIGERIAQFGTQNFSPDYLTFNLSGQYKLNKSFSVWCDIDNLFDTNYQEIFGYNSPGASATVGFRLEF